MNLTHVAQVDGPHAARATAAALVDTFMDVGVDLIRALALLISKVRHLSYYTYKDSRV